MGTCITEGKSWVYGQGVKWDQAEEGCPTKAASRQRSSASGSHTPQQNKKKESGLYRNLVLSLFLLPFPNQFPPKTCMWWQKKKRQVFTGGLELAANWRPPNLFFIDGSARRPWSPYALAIPIPYLIKCIHRCMFPSLVWTICQGGGGVR